MSTFESDWLTIEILKRFDGFKTNQLLFADVCSFADTLTISYSVRYLFVYSKKYFNNQKYCNFRLSRVDTLGFIFCLFVSPFYSVFKASRFVPLLAVTTQSPRHKIATWTCMNSRSCVSYFLFTCFFISIVFFNLRLEYA